MKRHRPPQPVLNRGLRPFLAKWHPRLEVWEATRKPEVSKKVHEKAWADEAECREALGELRKELGIYAAALAEIAGVRP